MKFYEFSDINRAMIDVRRGDTIKAVLRIGEVCASGPGCSKARGEGEDLLDRVGEGE